MKKFSEIFQPGLIVSCQAPEGTPLHGSQHMAVMAVAADVGGGVGIRANGPDDIKAICSRVKLPVLGIYKQVYDGSSVYITPTFEEAKAVVDAGSAAVAIDGTARPRPKGETLADQIKKIHEQLGVPVMADCSTYEEGMQAAELGADAVGSTLSGYTENSVKQPGPDLAMIQRLVAELEVPVVAEGRYHTPNDAAKAILAGAYAVVIGGAITRPDSITQRFVEEMKPYIR